MTGFPLSGPKVRICVGGRGGGARSSAEPAETVGKEGGIELICGSGRDSSWVAWEPYWSGFCALFRHATIVHPAT